MQILHRRQHFRGSSTIHGVRLITSDPNTDAAFLLDVSATYPSITVNWGDGSAPETYTTDGLKSHTYASAGTYDVTVTGSCVSWSWYGTGTTGALLRAILGLGYDCVFTTSASMFRGCTGLTGSIPALPSTLTSGVRMFYECTNLTGAVPALPSGLTSGADMFTNTGLTGSIPALPNSLGTISQMFKTCTGLTGSIPALPSNLTVGDQAFFGCTGLTGSIPALPSSLTNGNYMFRNCSKLTGSLPDMDANEGPLENVTLMFAGCPLLEGPSYPFWDWTDAPDAVTGCYRGCTGLTDYATIPAAYL